MKELILNEMEYIFGGFNLFGVVSSFVSFVVNFGVGFIFFVLIFGIVFVFFVGDSVMVFGFFLIG